MKSPRRLAPCGSWTAPATAHGSRTTQSELSRLSGVRQPSISQFLSGAVELSDDQLDRLLSCMGYRLEVTRRPVVPELTRSERRSWRLHCRLSVRLTPDSLQEWRPVIERNLDRLRGNVTGQPRIRNLDRWQSLVGHGGVRLADPIEGVAGEFSPFEELHGFSIDGVDLSTSALPPGWRGRLIKIQNANTAAPGGEPQSGLMR